jgi:HAD superfamily hydrolase (TIGR01509 family)
MADVLVFDMGGVLFDFQGDRMLGAASRGRRFRRAEVRGSWLPLMQRFETGVGSELEFAQTVVSTYDLKLDAAEFLTAFRGAALGFYAGAVALVEELAERQRVLSLSNTNSVQWPVVLAGLAPRDPFHAHHPSHLSGFHKPDPRAFTAIAADHALDSRFYFFDDREENVAAARALGWHAARVRGVAETRRACAELGLLKR